MSNDNEHEPATAAPERVIPLVELERKLDELVAEPDPYVRDGLIAMLLRELAGAQIGRRR